jgi:hypothetical protein
VPFSNLTAVLTFPAYSGLQDFVLALLPWTIVWNLQMKKKEKMGVAFAMSLGILYVFSPP